MVFIAVSKAFSPAFSSQAYSTVWPFLVNQSPWRIIGQTTARMPVAARSSTQPVAAIDRSVMVVTPLFSSSDIATWVEGPASSGSRPNTGRYS